MENSGCDGGSEQEQTQEKRRTQWESMQHTHTHTNTEQLADNEQHVNNSHEQQ